MTTPENVTVLGDKQVFVFGSNIKGEHYGGAALYAFDHFGAEWGVGEGLTGKCYALPTLNKDMGRFSKQDLSSIVEAFYRCADAHPGMTFLLTKVGCGIAGYKELEMARLFKDAPDNIAKPADW